MTAEVSRLEILRGKNRSIKNQHRNLSGWEEFSLAHYDVKAMPCSPWSQLSCNLSSLYHFTITEQSAFLSTLKNRSWIITIIWTHCTRYYNPFSKYKLPLWQCSWFWQASQYIQQIENNTCMQKLACVLN